MKNNSIIKFILWCIPFLCGSFTETKAQDIFLSDLPSEFIANEFGPPNRDLSFEKNPISINGKVFEKGLGVHAPSCIHVNVNGQGSKFLAVIGLDSEVIQKKRPPATRAATKFRNAFLMNDSRHTPMVRFIIRGDGHILYSSGWITESSPPQPVEVDISALTQLSLIVESGPDGPRNGNADWADARLIMKNDIRSDDLNIYYHSYEKVK